MKRYLNESTVSEDEFFELLDSLPTVKNNKAINNIKKLYQNLFNQAMPTKGKWDFAVYPMRWRDGTLYYFNNIFTSLKFEIYGLSHGVALWDINEDNDQPNMDDNIVLDYKMSPIEFNFSHKGDGFGLLSDVADAARLLSEALENLNTFINEVGKYTYKDLSCDTRERFKPSYYMG